MLVHFQNVAIHFKPKKAPILLPNSITMDSSDFGSCFEALVKGEKNITVEIDYPKFRQLLTFINREYVTVKAAGGVVWNREGKMLIMTRNGRHDLPKGKLEDGETLAMAAIRETMEETGVNQLSLGKLHLKTYHIYNLYGGWHFKQTSWFEMFLNGNDQTLSPQTEEGITAAEWVQPQVWHQRLAESYSTMRYLASQTPETSHFDFLG